MLWHYEFPFNISGMAELVLGEVGLVITGQAHVTREGQAGPRQMGIYSEAMIDSLKRVPCV